jgi:hypothetical protein
MTALQNLLGVRLPIIQAPMAGVQDSRLALAVSNAGGLGSLPCAMLTVDAIRQELTAIRAGTDKPFNVNFFCHDLPAVSAEREAKWRATLAPYYAEFGVDVNALSARPARAPFSQEIADILEEFKPPVVSFHFGLPSAQLLGRVKAWGARVLSSANNPRGSVLVGSERRRCDYRARSRGGWTSWHVPLGGLDHSDWNLCPGAAGGSRGSRARRCCGRHRGLNWSYSRDGAGCGRCASGHYIPAVP